MIQVVASFCLVLGLLFALIFGLKYLQQKQFFSRFGLQSKKIHLIDSLAIDAKRRIVHIQHETDSYLILLGVNHDLLLRGPTTQSVASFTTELNATVVNGDA